MRKSLLWLASIRGGFWGYPLVKVETRYESVVRGFCKWATGRTSPGLAQTVRPIVLALKGRKGVFIMDATKQLLYGEYEGIAEQTVVHEVVRKDGKVVQTRVHESRCIGTK